MTLIWGSAAALALGAGIFWLWQVRRRQASIAEAFQWIASALRFGNPSFQKLPRPALFGTYYGYRVALEGRLAKNDHSPHREFLIVGTVELPRKIPFRVFIQHESLKTSLKPVASLKLLQSGDESFDRFYLTLTSDPEKGAACFSPYLREKFLSLSERRWQADIHGKYAHLRLWQSAWNPKGLACWLEVTVECLNVVASLA